jgi:hypothetical protein
MPRPPPIIMASGVWAWTAVRAMVVETAPARYTRDRTIRMAEVHAWRVLQIDEFLGAKPC